MRRTMWGFLKAFLAVAVIGGLVLTHAPAARASADWCWDDPTVSINGRTVSIVEGVFGEPRIVDANVRTAHVLIYVPLGVSTKVLGVTNEYFNERVYSVPTATPWRTGDPIPVRVDVFFEALANMPAQVRVTHPGGTATTSGTTLSRMSVQFTLQ